MSKVQNLIAALKEDGFVNVDWIHTGGGCYAIQLPLGAFEHGDYSDILITGEDVFTDYDYDHDDDVNGEWFADRHDENGDSTTDGNGIIYTADTEALIAAINANLDA